MLVQMSADRWIGLILTTVQITVAKQAGKILVNGEKAEMKYNGIQLRFTLLAKKCVYIVFDDRHKPPRPIKELYRALK